MSKITFVLCGLLLLLTVLASAENEEQSISKKTFSLRAVRDADAVRRKKNRNGRVRAALLKIKSTTYKLFFVIFLTTVLL